MEEAFAETTGDNKKFFEEAISYYEKMENHQRSNAKTFLIGIMGCLVICLIIFLSANILVSSKESKLAEINALQFQQELKTNEDSIASITKQILSIKNHDLNYEEPADSVYDENLKALIKLYFKDSVAFSKDTGRFNRVRHISKLKSGTDMNKFRTDSLELEKVHNAYINKANAALKDSLTKTKTGLTTNDAQLSKLIGQKNSEVSVYDFINSTSTRIGAILILIFMVQILSGIYRYNTKLSNYYGARAIAIKLHLTKDSSFQIEKILKLISPENIEIRSTKPPTDKVMEMVKSIIESTANAKKG